MLAVKARALSDSTFWVLAVSILTRGITDLGMALGAALALALGAYRVTHWLMSIESLLIVLMAGTEIFRPLRDLRTVLHQGMAGQSAAAGILALLGCARFRADGRRLRRSVASHQVRACDIAFEDVSFAYPGGRGAALDGLNFRCRRRRAGRRRRARAARANPSIVRLLLRFTIRKAAPSASAGTICASSIPTQVRRQIAVVAQDTYLFHGTVEDNLRLGRPDASERNSSPPRAPRMRTSSSGAA